MINKILINILKKENIFSFKKKEKEKFLKNYFNLLTKYHYIKSSLYKNILNKFNYNLKKNYNISDLPFLPVGLFKKLDLISVKRREIVRTMHSSGTTSINRSKIFLDKFNSKNQMLALNKLFSSMTETNIGRFPMLIIDQNLFTKKTNYFSARLAALAGFSIFSSERIFAFNDDMSINIDAIEKFTINNKNKKKIILGQTYLIWKYLLNDKKSIFKKYDLRNSILLHGGGWKKLEKEKVSNLQFKEKLKEVLAIDSVINYYGMIEQTGSIFFECKKCNNFVTSIFSDIIIRDSHLKDVGFNKKGMIQLLSILPTSYPGHNILTEDLGMIISEDDCPCGKMGKRFRVFGRLKNSEVRGCSDAIS